MLGCIICFCIVFHVAVSVCTSDQVFVKSVLKSHYTTNADYFSIVIPGQSSVLYTNPTPVNDQVNEDSFCLPANTYNQYELHMGLNGNAWSPSNWLALYGEYGNLVFKGYYLSGAIQISFYTPIRKGDAWKKSTSFQFLWNKVDFNDNSWDIFAGTSSSHTFLRKSFPLPVNQVAFELSLYYQYGIIVYVNGNEIIRDNLPSGEISLSTFALHGYSSYEDHHVIRSISDLSTNSVVAIHLVPLSSETVMEFDAYLATYASSFPSHMIPCYPHSFSMENSIHSALFDWSTTTYEIFDKSACVSLPSNVLSFEVNQARFTFRSASSIPSIYQFKWGDFHDSYRYTSTIHFYSLATDLFVTDGFRKYSSRVAFCFTPSTAVQLSEIISYTCAIPTLHSLSYGDEKFVLHTNTYSVISPTHSFQFQSCMSSTLPAGLGLTSTAVISGIPTVPSEETETTIICNGGSVEISVVLSITVLPQTHTFYYNQTSFALAIGESYEIIPVVVGESLIFSIQDGELPAGITLSSAGILQGTPTTACESTVTIKMIVNNSPLFCMLSFSVVNRVSIAYPQANISLIMGQLVSIIPTIEGDAAYFSISSGLPSGLLFNPTTGEITGSPLEEVSQFSTTISVHNAVGNDSTSLLFTVGSPTPISSFSYPSDYLFFTRAVFMEVLPVLEGSPTRFSIESGTLPLGLSLDISSGSIIGSAVSETRNQMVVIKATNVLSFMLTTVYITVETTQTTFSYNDTPFIVGTSLPITISPLFSMTGPFSLQSGSLPEGLMLNATSGVIEGTPSQPLSTVVYLLAGSNQIQLEITVRAAPTISYSLSSTTILVKEAFSALPVVSGEQVVFSLHAGSLPEGLVLDPLTGEISGIPLKREESVAFIRALNQGGSALFPLTLITRSKPVIDYGSNYINVILNEDNSFFPISECYNCVWSIGSYVLPSGLSFDTSTGEIYGIVTENKYLAIHISASNEYGSETINLSIVVYGRLSNFSYSQDKSIQNCWMYYSLMPSYSGTSPSFSIEPELPKGLSFSSSGSISGYPKESKYELVYTITATNAVSSVSTTITLRPVYPLKSITYPQSTYSLVQNVEFLTCPVVVGDHPTYSIVFGSLPDGLLLDEVTGCIEGVPTSSESAAVRVRAGGITKEGDIEGFFYIEFDFVTPPSAFEYPSRSYTISLDEESEIAPSSTISGDFYILSGELPIGMSLDTSTGIISGKPAQVVSSTIRIMNYNEAGSVIADLVITVEDRMMWIVYLVLLLILAIVVALCTLLRKRSNKTLPKKRI